jgi:hypothetical protein
VGREKKPKGALQEGAGRVWIDETASFARSF